MRAVEGSHVCDGEAPCPRAALRKEVGEDRLYILKLDVEDAAAVAASVKELESSGCLNGCARSKALTSATAKLRVHAQHRRC
jgi:hypothetical protein